MNRLAAPTSYEDAVRRWNGKPYYSLDCYLKNRFHEKVYKLALDGGFTCPNRDGTLDRRGCIFLQRRRFRRLCRQTVTLHRGADPGG